MTSLDDCRRADLKALAAYATPAQIAEARAKNARAEANRAHEDYLLASARCLEDCRSARRNIGTPLYHAAFENALRAQRLSRLAEKIWSRLELEAQKLEREAKRAAS